jgi:orotate phosphoribosyltransferase
MVQKVVLVEDLQTDGFSKKVFVDALRDAGCLVNYGFVIFHYGIYPASKKNMADMKLNLLALTELKDVLEVAKEDNYFNTDTLKSFEQFLADPITWSVSHGGKGDETLDAA